MTAHHLGHTDPSQCLQRRRDVFVAANTSNKPSGKVDNFLNPVHVAVDGTTPHRQTILYMGENMNADEELQDIVV